MKYAELLVTEVASSKNLVKSQQLLELCRPVSPEHPSTVERVLLAERDRIIAKTHKGSREVGAGRLCIPKILRPMPLPGNTP